MEKQQERLQHHGFLGIFRESFKLLSSRKKILSQITAATIFPLCFIFFAHLEISEYLFSKIARVQLEIDVYPNTTPKYAELSDISPAQWTLLALFQLLCLIIFFFLYLFSSFATIHTIASVYTSTETTFKKSIMGSVPKVWKRFLITFLMNFFIVLIYTIVGVVLPYLIGYLLNEMPAVLILFICGYVIAWSVGLVYIITLCQLGTVACVLEDVKGVHAMKKGKNLMKGKRVVALAIFLILTLCYCGIQFLFQWLVVFYLVGDGSIGSRIGYAIMCFFLQSILAIFGLVVQTVIYIVCKSIHRETLGSSSVSDCPEANLGNYVPLKSQNVELRQLPV